MDPILNEVLNTYRAFDLERFDYPREGDWVLAWETMQFVGRLVELIRPQRMVELGSGHSTEVLSTVVAGFTGQVISFEHSAGYARATEARVHARGLSGTARVLRRRLTLRRYGSKLLPTYSFRRDDLHGFRPFDVALIDGPPGHIGREATLYELFPRLALGAWVVADDMNRPGERRWLRAWKEAFGGALEIHMFPKIGEGAALLRKRAEGNPAYPSLSARLTRLWNRKIRRTAPRDGEP
jgi:predicted O-methyltransferase YrrM